jgi:hypothetical protein
MYNVSIDFEEAQYNFNKLLLYFGNYFVEMGVAFKGLPFQFYKYLLAHGKM